MKHTLYICSLFTLLAATVALADEVLPPIRGIHEPGNTPPILVSMSGFTGEAATAMQFDLYVHRVHECRGGAIPHLGQQQRQPAGAGHRPS